MNIWKPYQLRVEMISTSVSDPACPGQISLELFAQLRRMEQPLHGAFDFFAQLWARSPQGALEPKGRVVPMANVQVDHGRVVLAFELSRAALIDGVTELEVSVREHGAPCTPVDVQPMVNLAPEVVEVLRCGPQRADFTNAATRQSVPAAAR